MPVNWVRPTYSYGRKGLWRGHATVTTTDATQTEIATFNIYPGETASVRVTVIAQNAAGSAYAMYHCNTGFYNNNGTMTQIDDLYDDASYESDSSYDFDITADDSNDTIDFQVTGKASTTLYWVADIEVLVNRGGK